MATPTPHSTAPHTPGAEPDPNSSSSTLVNHGLTSPTPHDLSSPSSPPSTHTPTGSPFSASFDPNVSAPTTPLYPITEIRLSAASTAAAAADEHALWAHRLSASFGAIADHIALASRTLATVPPSASASARAPSSAAGPSGNAEVGALVARLDTIERAQERLGAELQQVQAQLARLQVTERGTEVGGGRAVEEKDSQVGDVTVVEVQEDSQEGGSSEFKSAAEMAIEELQKKVDGVVETIKLDQSRLYARLHNATVTLNKTQIKAPMMANGKAPQNFPNTKGEFEHLTKERYESLLKSYNLPIKGDTSAKREALREFIGLTPPS